ncbi:uncharacterized protein LOC112084665 [Eutrema salsugineum]|uniref:uncharacterized protein LOC112084665 n=1 Tax=Eutrema salsugineum TaxID=72664 RepID=UPI000CED79FE|nr:uncharacterized protein LOC112084665 [Eutrema salsugineum]
MEDAGKDDAGKDRNDGLASNEVPHIGGDTFVDATMASKRIDEVLQDINTSDLIECDNTDLPIPSIPPADPTLVEANVQAPVENADLQVPIPESDKVAAVRILHFQIQNRLTSKQMRLMQASQIPIPSPLEIRCPMITLTAQIQSQKYQESLYPVIDDPPSFSLGLTQEEKNLAESRQIEEEVRRVSDIADSSKSIPPIRKSVRPRVPASTSEDFVYPQNKKKKTNKTVDLSSFFPRPTEELVSLLEARIKEMRVIPRYGVNLTPNIVN